MKDYNWVKFTIAKLQKHLRPLDITQENPLKATKMEAITYVVDELRDASLEDIADLIINLIISDIEAEAAEIKALQEENYRLKEQLRENAHNLEAIVKEMQVEG